MHLESYNKAYVYIINVEKFDIKGLTLKIINAKVNPQDSAPHRLI